MRGSVNHPNDGIRAYYENTWKGKKATVNVQFGNENKVFLYKLTLSGLVHAGEN